jgi:hypothetical protein
MIDNFEEITYELNETERKLLPFVIEGMNHHQGKERAITGTKIRQAILDKKGVKVSGARLRKIIHYLRVSGECPLLVATSEGYFIAQTESEVTSFLNSIQQRINSMTELRDAVRDQFNDKMKQIKMEFDDIR